MIKIRVVLSLQVLVISNKSYIQIFSNVFRSVFNKTELRDHLTVLISYEYKLLLNVEHVCKFQVYLFMFSIYNKRRDLIFITKQDRQITARQLSSCQYLNFRSFFICTPFYSQSNSVTKVIQKSRLCAFKAAFFNTLKINCILTKVFFKCQCLVDRFFKQVINIFNCMAVKKIVKRGT